MLFKTSESYDGDFLPTTFILDASSCTNKQKCKKT